MVTTEQTGSAIAIVLAVSETIRELRAVPSGTLYAQLCGRLTFQNYTALLRTLERAGLISISGAHEIRWIGPEVA